MYCIMQSTIHDISYARRLTRRRQQSTIRRYIAPLYNRHCAEQDDLASIASKCC